MDKIEAQAFLVNLFKDIKEQDNRCTASPYYYQIRDMRRVWRGTDGGEHRSWVESCGDELEAGSWYGHTKEETEYLKDHFEIEDDTDKESEGYKEYEYLSDDYHAFEKFMQERDFTLQTYDYEPVYHGCFLTEKAAKQFLKSNNYHYGDEATTYVRHFWRNNEMKNLLIAAATMAGVEYKEK
jgi:hypothetical protein